MIVPAVELGGAGGGLRGVWPWPEAGESGWCWRTCLAVGGAPVSGPPESDAPDNPEREAEADCGAGRGGELVEPVEDDAEFARGGLFTRFMTMMRSSRGRPRRRGRGCRADVRAAEHGARAADHEVDGRRRGRRRATAARYMSCRRRRSRRAADETGAGGVRGGAVGAGGARDLPARRSRPRRRRGSKG